MNQGNSEQQQQPQTQLPNCSEIIGRLPFWTRLTYFSLVIIWVLDLFSSMPALYLGSNITTISPSNYHLWTLLTANFYVDRLFLVILIIYNFSTFLPKLVHFSSIFRKNGSLRLSSC